MKIKKVEIEGFRAYKFKKDGTFDFTVDGKQPSNFVAIYAPNGFGKSAFYDAVEWAFTANIERYVQDHNRKNNELAARSTKQAGIAQCILRNKYVTKDTPTSVNVDTTSQSYSRTLGRVRADSRDLKFRKDDTEEGTEFFRSVILSQDAIDRFLGEIKPQERYNLFMEHFGGDTERLRQEITALLNDNKSILNSLSKQRDDLKVQLKEPVDDSIFSEFNVIATSLNEDGESVALVSGDFTANTEHEIISSIVTRTHELTSIRNIHRVSHKVLKEQLSRLPEIQSALNSITSEKPQLAKLTKGVGDAQGYQEFLNSYDKCTKDLHSTNQQFENLQEIERHIPKYILATQELRVEMELQKNFNKKKSEKETTLKTLELSAKQQSESLLDVAQRKLNLGSLLNECGSIYADISTNQALLATLKTELVANATTLDIETTDRDRVADEIVKLSNIKVDRKTLLTQNISVLNPDAEVLTKIQEIEQQLNILEIEDQSILRTQAALTLQMGIVERLVSLGLEYVNAKPTNTCPLCQLKHPSPDKLKAAMEENDLVSDLIRDNAHDLEKLSSHKKELSGRLDSILAEVTIRQSNRIAELQLKLKDLGLKITELERKRVAVQARVSSTQKYIETCQTKVWNLEQEELVGRINTEMRELAENHSQKLEHLNAVTVEIETIKGALSSVNSGLQQSLLKMKGITSQEYYGKVQLFLEVNGVSSTELYAFCSKKINEVSGEKLELTQQRDKIALDNDTLKTEMLADGNWIDFATLNQQKTDTSTKLSGLEFIVNSFFESIDKSLGQTASRSIDGVRTEISEAIDEVLQKGDALGEKISKFELLSAQVTAFKPYILSLTLRETLIDVEKKLSQHIHVGEILSKELEVIFANLKDRIGAFFYTDLINSIYSKIDPHPSFKKVAFVPDFDESNRPKLNIVITDDSGDVISPSLYFSTAQLNILTLSVFLARALHAKDDEGVPLDVILIDDPIQSMDSINVLAMIDLIRNISVKFDKQVIISTHNENFFRLLQRKIPSEILGSKFITLESFGVVSPPMCQDSFRLKKPVQSYGRSEKQECQNDKQ